MALRLRQQMQSKYFLQYLKAYNSSAHRSSIRKFHRVACVIPNPCHRHSLEQRGLLDGEVTAFQVPKFILRNYCTPKSNDDGEEFTNPAADVADKSTELDNIPIVHSLPATVVIPEHWPHVPLIAVNRNPVFPRFIKLLEVG